jgi:HlyD family secretion protein
MTRLILTLGCWLVALALIEAGWAAEPPKPAAEKPAPAQAKPEAAAEKPKPPAEKPQPPEAKPQPPAEKPQPPAEKPEAEGRAKAPAGQPAETHTVKPELLKIEVSLDGVFEAQTMTEIALRPESWSSFKVLKAVEHGRSVGQGDVLVQFDPKEIDKAVDDQRTGQKLAELTFKQAEIGLKILEQTTPMDVAAAERNKRHAEEDMARFFEIDRQMRRKSADQSLKSSEQSLEYQLEELRQLEKMYKADDLTEETEEIILKRQRDAVERYKWYLEMAKVDHEQTLKTDLPRQDESIRQMTEAIKLVTERAKATLPLQLQSQQIELEKMKVQRAQDEEKLQKLLADQALMTIKSPAEGVVYYGKCVRGQFSGGSSMAEKLRPGQSVAANSVLMTIVKPRPLIVRVTVPEKELHWIRSGLKATVQPVAYPDLRLAASVAGVNVIPEADGKFVAELRVNLDPQADAITPGMNCKVKLIPYLKQRTLTVPASAVKTDELDDQRHYVYLVDKDGKQKKQPVTVGKKTEDQVEILDGLVAGDKVLKQAPKEEP